MKLNSASYARLRGVHPDLVRVVLRCAADWAEKDTGFIVTCGVRTLEEQKLLKAKGATRTLRSRHLTGHAVDLAVSVRGQIRWDWSLYIKLANAMKNAAKTEKVPVRWGGSWELLNTVRGPITSAILSKSFPDGPHYELPRDTYADTKQN
jgi:peptidoglycan L-alanyl-D-glutamate endopeptidase CwlK